MAEVFRRGDITRIALGPNLKLQDIAPSGYVISLARNINLRNRPLVRSKTMIKELIKGQQVKVKGESADGEWLIVITDDLTMGYIKKNIAH